MDSRRLWNDDDFLPPSPPHIPAEIVRKIVLFRLADAVWALVVEPGLENDRDPFLPLLHTSSQFREITAKYLDHIIDEPQEDPLDRSITPASNITYQAMQSVLSQLKELAVLLNPPPYTRYIVMDQIYMRLRSTPDDCKSPILWHAWSITTARLQIRNLERDCSETFCLARTTLIAPMKNYAESAPQHASDGLLRPIRTLFLAYEVLLFRTSVLHTLCNAACDIFARCPDSDLRDTFLQSEEDLLEEKYRVAKESLCVLRLEGEEAPPAEVYSSEWTGWNPSMLLIPGCPPTDNVDPESEMPIPADALKAIKFHKVLQDFQHPPGRPDDIWLLQFCRRAREALVSYLPWSQRDEFKSLLAEPIMPRSHF